MSGKAGHWAQGLGQQPSSMRPAGSLARANSDRTLNPLSAHNASTRHCSSIQSHVCAGGEASRSMDTQSGVSIISTAYDRCDVTYIQLLLA